MLGDVVVLDLTGLVGQFAGKILSDLGLLVVKIEPPGGDDVRRIGPFKDGRPGTESSLAFAYLNAGKRSVTLDIESPAGRDILDRLLDHADIVLESFAAADAERLGLTQSALRASRPQLIVISITGYGKSGPRSDQLSPDIVTLATGGILNMSGTPELPPCRPPEYQSYYITGAYAAMTALGSLHGREISGAGESADLSVQEAVATQEHLIRAWAVDQTNVVRHGSQHRSVAPANIYATRDGYVYLYVSHDHWTQFLSVWTDHPEDLGAKEWRSNLVRRRDADRINAVVAEFVGKYTTTEFVDLLQGAGIPCLPVNSPRDFLSDPHIAARGVFQPVSHPHLGNYQAMTFPVQYDDSRLGATAPPLLGQHTNEILTGMLGLDETDLALLLERRVI